ncbi:MAG: dimethyl sulfoxide reductase anchor subunit [Anaerolineae bacterium]|nr:dimethyl sulfoxide reductase anchor subunit [Anaerolineae bacterium]MCA9895129.1 dimethyl sulfoxide reductase anchor subunit [Anaerolineae bacterium]MCB9461161.1 dimethyl sulfoxide reductase anchor subunit [Anaerolineaceae bacterium]
MQANEWSLIIFTTVMQMAVGSFVILGGVHFFATRRYGDQAADALSDRALLAIGPVVILAMLVTFLHLGNPLNAPQAISNLGSSWLSREVALAVVFTIGGAIFALMQWRKISTLTVRSTVGLVVAAIGLLLVWAMAQVYLLPTVPAWNSPATIVTFFITTLLLGSLAVGSAFVITYQYLRSKGTLPNTDTQFDILSTTLRWIVLISLVLLGIQFVVIPLYLANLAEQGSEAALASISLILDEGGALFALRLILLFVGAGIFSIFMYRTATSENRTHITGYLAFSAFAFVLISEILGRFLFYESMMRIGL